MYTIMYTEAELNFGPSLMATRLVAMLPCSIHHFLWSCSLWQIGLKYDCMNCLFCTLSNKKQLIYTVWHYVHMQNLVAIDLAIFAW